MNPSPSENQSHKRWVKSSHWIITISFFALAITGFEMIMVHPRFYWGEVGNDLTPVLFELPVSRNYQHGGWDKNMVFFDSPNSPVSAGRTYDIFNENGWGRSLHFLSGWFFLITGLIYFIIGLFTRHFKNHLWPKSKELSLRLLWQDVVNHMSMKIAVAPGPDYGLLQKITYLIVIFVLIPVIILSGFTMSPAITAAYPFLLKLFLGAQSARTIHFIASSSLVLFLIIHVVMIIKSGFKQQIRAMTIGK